MVKTLLLLVKLKIVKKYVWQKTIQLLSANTIINLIMPPKKYRMYAEIERDIYVMGISPIKQSPIDPSH